MNTHSLESLRASEPPQFYLYGDAPGESALDFSWLRGCAGFSQMLRTSAREQLAEVFLHDLLRKHASRTSDAADAVLFYVPVWVHVSNFVGTCNGTTNRDRMSLAAAALKASPLFRSRNGQPPGFDHMFASTHFGEPRFGIIMKGFMMELIKHFIVGYDYATDVHGYGAFRGRALGRCSIELPYVANPFALAARRPADAARSRLLHFRGSLSVCCSDHAQGPEIRQAVARLQNFSQQQGLQEGSKSLLAHRSRRSDGDRNSVLIVAVARRKLTGLDINATSASEDLRRARTAQFEVQGVEMADSDFCLCPAGDASVTSRVYSSIAAGCIPVVIAPGFSGAFASHVPYERLVLRVRCVSATPHSALCCARNADFEPHPHSRTTPAPVPPARSGSCFAGLTSPASLEITSSETASARLSTHTFSRHSHTQRCRLPPLSSRAARSPRSHHSATEALDAGAAARLFGRRTL